ncbi:ribosome maturation factor RimM [Moraxella caviae]|uniref:Ribosome maturation factor RimM n=1 Tax=Moraxella caviae TaxID=34060 RepID=A0A1T0A1E2_9GAMM|nr:ribosome maturation factor RimM [Moraxella caviae]OOR89563.1 ribosome maturation factor RimM [Moraxella caviae]STZ10242.1 Ribosome maturation factor rimM [Moraxella caviae]
MTATAPNADQLIKIATLKKPYGIKGWLWVFSDTDNRADVFAMQPWWMKTATGFKPLTVTNWREQGQGLVASFKEVPDRNVAETMNGVTVWTERANLPALDEEEYYWSDLVGLVVVNEAGETLGKIKNLFETGAHEIITVAPTAESIDNEERLIPWHKDVVLKVDLAAATMLVAWGADY